MMKSANCSLVIIFALVLSVLSQIASRADPPRPNFLWLSAEDISPHLGCYGDPHAITPNLDRLSEESIRYSHAFTTAGVCAPCRSGIITGMYQTTLGTHHMRGRAKLPAHVRPFPVVLREAGYYASNNSKEDYQFTTPAETWNDSSRRAHWRGAKQGQPFFAVFNFGGCHESGIADTAKYQQVTAALSPAQRQNAAELSTFPPYYPDTPAAREDWKRNYELITAMDQWAGDLIQQLKADGLYDDTIIMFWSDHGVGLPRAKRWLYDSGTHVPLIVRVPEKYRAKGQPNPGTVFDELASSIDFGPTVLRLAGLEVPDHMQGQPFLGENCPAPREYVFGARDRMDERYDIIRMVRDKRFKYLRNYEPLKGYFQRMETPEKGATMKSLRRAHATGLLPPAAKQYFADSKPVEELYDTDNDPYEIHNLAEDPNYAEVLRRMRDQHVAWVKRTRDLGLVPEPILLAREKELGNRYDVLRQSDGEALAARIADAALAASAGASGIPTLLEALRDEDPAVRFWGAVGFGNLGEQTKLAQTELTELLQDSSNSVRVMAARALCGLETDESALSVLTTILHQGTQWERLMSAIVLDELDERAVPVVASMREALTPRETLFAKGKYTVRVIKRALAELPADE